MPRVIESGPAVREPGITADSYQADDGTDLPLEIWGPEQPVAVVLALHGFGDYANAFDMPATHLAARDIRTYAFDQRGFGRTADRGYWHGVDRMIADAAGAARAIARRHEGTPVYLMGLSMGGALAMSTAAAHPDLPVKGLILASPAVWGREFMAGYQSTALTIGAYLIPWFPLTGQGFKIKASDNEEMLRALANDPHALHRFRVDLVWGLTNMMDRGLAAAPELNKPSLFLYGLRDQLVPLAPTRAALERIPAQYRRVALYTDGYHMLLRDLRGDLVADDIAGWISAPSAPLANAAKGNWRTGLRRNPDDKR